MLQKPCFFFIQINVVTRIIFFASKVNLEPHHNPLIAYYYKACAQLKSKISNQILKSQTKTKMQEEGFNQNMIFFQIFYNIKNKNTSIIRCEI